MLESCPDCGRESPNDLDICPFCGLEKEGIATLDDQTTTVLLDVTSHIQFAGLAGKNNIITLTTQAGATWLHTVTPNGSDSVMLFDAPLPIESQFGMCGNLLVVEQPEMSDLIVFNTDLKLVQGIVKDTARSQLGTLLWGANRKLIFVTRDGDLIAVVPQADGLIAKTVAKDIGDNVVHIAPVAKGVMVFYETGSCRFYDLKGNWQWVAKLTKRPAYTHLMRVVVDYSSTHVLIRRVFHGGKGSVVVTDIRDSEGYGEVRTCMQPIAEYPSAMNIQQGLFWNGSLLHANWAGVIREDILTGETSLLGNTAGVINPPAFLLPFNGGLAVVYNRVIEHISLD